MVFSLDQQISFFGVSLFPVANLEELTQVRDGVHVQTDEVPYNLLRRGIELDLLPWCRARGILSWPAGNERDCESDDARSHPREPRALDVRLTPEDVAELDRPFPRQIQPRPSELR